MEILQKQKRRKTLGVDDKNSPQFKDFDYHEINRRKEKIFTSMNLSEKGSPKISIQAEKLSKVIKKNLIRNINDEKSKIVTKTKKEANIKVSHKELQQFKEVNIFKKVSDSGIDDKTENKHSNVRINNYFDNSILIKKSKSERKDDSIEKTFDDIRNLKKMKN